MKKVMLMAAAIVFCGITVFAAHTTSTIPNTAKTKKVKPAKVQYTCKMHPNVISYKPGKCPKCAMTLVKKQSANKMGM
jgi:Heavy metal binding domain